MRGARCVDGSGWGTSVIVSPTTVRFTASMCSIVASASADDRVLIIMVTLCVPSVRSLYRK
jgi:hypothetical protein